MHFCYIFFQWIYNLEKMKEWILKGVFFMKLIDLEKFERSNFENGVNLKLTNDQQVYLQIKEMSENGKDVVKRSAVLTCGDRVIRKFSTVFPKGNDTLCDHQYQELCLMFGLLQLKHPEDIDFYII